MKRTYRKRARVMTPALKLCPVANCNRKYKTERKLIAHVEKAHYFDTRFASSWTFDLETKIKICDLASSYARRMFDPQRSAAGAYNLLPQLAVEEISHAEKVRIVKAEETFIRRFMESNLFQSCDWSKVLDDFEKFFQLGLPYYDTNFCPSLPIDFLWHAVMQDRTFYASLCHKFVQDVIPHCQIERSEEVDQARFEYFIAVFQNRYHRSPHMPPSLPGKATLEGVDLIFDKLREKFVDIQVQEIAEKQRAKETQFQRKVAREREMQGFCAQHGVSVNDWWEYNTYYKPAAQRGFSGADIERAVWHQKNSRRLMSSSC